MKELVNNIFDKEITSALDGFPSVYSKDDLICVVNRIRFEINELELPKPEIDKEALNVIFQEVIVQFYNQLERSNTDYIDYGSAEFSIAYNNVLEISNIDIIIDNITESLEGILEEVFYEALDVRE
ncbi:MAG: hypothetical protein ACOVK2_05220 [Candidatus Fonsibacter sp.]